MRFCTPSSVFWFMNRGKIHSAQEEMLYSGMNAANREETMLKLPPVSPETISSILETVSCADISQKDAFHTILKENVRCAPIS